MALSALRPARPPWSDVVLASGFLAVSLAQVAVAPIASPVVSVVVAVGATVPLAWRRVAPATAALAGTAVWTIPTPRGFLLLGFVIAVLLYFSLGAHARGTWRVAVVAAVGATTGVVVTLLGPEDPPVAIGAALAVVAPAVAGRLVAQYRAQAARLQELTGELVRERAAAERTAAAEERARIARELHDVIGHEVTVIALQADAAAAALAGAPERAAAPVAAIRRSAAEALAEMRRVVGLLRTAEDDADLRPQPGLADVPALVDRARAAGSAVELVLVPPETPPPRSVQVTAYRVVQEALTNAGRHAPGSAARVRVVTGDGELCVEVVSRGGGRGRTTGGGHGLAGMRERVRVHGGQLSAGPVPGGFAVTARLPLAARGAP